MRVVAYVPLKLNNERLPSKNTKSFTNGKPLLTYILDTLSSCEGINDRYVYCSDPSVKKFLPDNFRYLTRDTSLDRSDTRINEVMTSFMRDVDADVYVLAHATAPFISRKSIEIGVEKVASGLYDSAFSVQSLQEFLWLDNKPVNYDPALIPRTQDLVPFFYETTGLYIYSKKILELQGRRIGVKPYLIEVSKIEAIDINEPIDFNIADAVFNSIQRKSTD
jgi:CMP-N-acetylneuraminic acid synthetase